MLILFLCDTITKVKYKTNKGEKMDKNIIREIYVVGIPTIILEIVSSFIMLWINKILIDYSEAAVTVCMKSIVNK